MMHEQQHHRAEGDDVEPARLRSLVAGRGAIVAADAFRPHLEDPGRRDRGHEPEQQQGR
jgi:hypothetical protein